jgi:arylsulfatase A-like enzyme
MVVNGLKRVLGMCLLMLGAASAFGKDQPNILFLLSDDQQWSGLSVAMHPDHAASRSQVIATPNVARLAAQGMRFSRAYAPAPVCSPTRISLQTGKSPAQLNWTKAAPVMTARDGLKLLPPTINRNISSNETTIGELLQQQGYATAHYGKWHIGGGGPAAHGYDQSDGDTGNEDAVPHTPPNPVDIFGMGRRAMDFMERSVAAQQPFFIQMSYHALHHPENADPKLVQKYQGLLAKGEASKGDSKKSGRAALAEDLDRGVGQLMAKLDALGISDNTYVIYMSDNGSWAMTCYPPFMNWPAATSRYRRELRGEALPTCWAAGQNP